MFSRLKAPLVLGLTGGAFVILAFALPALIRPDSAGPFVAIGVLGVSLLIGAVAVLIARKSPAPHSAVPPPYAVAATGPGEHALGVFLGTALLCLVLVFAGILLTSPLVDGFESFALAVAPIWAAISIVGLAGGYAFLRSGSKAVWPPLLMLAAAWIPAVAGILLLANEYFDGSEGEVHELRLLSHQRNVQHRSGTRNRESFYLVFESWRGRGSEMVWVSGETYSEARPKQTWSLTVHQGWLGQPWIGELEPIR